MWALLSNGLQSLLWTLFIIYRSLCRNVLKHSKVTLLPECNRMLVSYNTCIPMSPIRQKKY